MKPDTQQSAVRRLARIEGRVRGISKMVQEDKYCIDIVRQVQAVKAALKIPVLGNGNVQSLEDAQKLMVMQQAEMAQRMSMSIANSSQSGRRALSPRMKSFTTPWHTVPKTP